MNHLNDQMIAAVETRFAALDVVAYWDRVSIPDASAMTIFRVLNVPLQKVAEVDQKVYEIADRVFGEDWSFLVDVRQRQDVMPGGCYREQFLDLVWKRKEAAAFQDATLAISSTWEQWAASAGPARVTTIATTGSSTVLTITSWEQWFHEFQHVLAISANARPRQGVSQQEPTVVPSAFVDRGVTIDVGTIAQAMTGCAPGGDRWVSHSNVYFSLAA